MMGTVHANVHHLLRSVCVIAVIVAAIVVAMPSEAQQTFDYGLDNLPPCNFNAHTDRDDIIIGAVLLHPRAGYGCMQNLNSTFPFASVGKLFVAGALYEKVVEGEISFETELVFTYDYWMGGGSDCLTDANIGGSFTIGYLSDIMISCSDNASTWMLMDYIGWDTVQNYVERLGIPGIGYVIPYSEVDRIKLTLMDERWATVPAGMASRYYRSRWTEGLVPDYFERVPPINQQDVREANAQYLENFSYNTATPRAMAEFLLKLYQDAQQPDTTEGQVAFWIFNAMLRTQRVFSTQDMPGTVYAGSKNGFDIGYRAEVNITISSLDARVPETISILVVKQRDLRDAEVNFRFRSAPPTTIMRDLSPYVSRTLYPHFNATVTPTPRQDQRVQLVAFNSRNELFPCWQSYLGTDFLDSLQNCWQNIPTISSIPADDFLGVGMVVRGMNGEDVRVTVVYTLPDGSHRSYQIDSFPLQSTAVAWFEEVDVPGRWRVDVFFNLLPVFTQQILVQ